MVSLDLFASSCSFLLIVFIYLRSRRRSFNRLPLPPGPRKRFLVGNLFDIPKQNEWIRYHNLCRDYDTDILHLDMMGTSVIVLDTAEAAMELFERRSTIYSGRPKAHMLELMGWGFAIGITDYGETWRAERRLAHQSFHSSAAKRFRPYSLKAAHGYLRRMLDHSEEIVESLHYMTGEIVLSITYGLDILPHDDPYINLVVDAVIPALIACVPGSYLVDFLPILRHVPEWMPGAGFKRKAKEWRKLAMRMLDEPYKVAKTQMEAGSHKPSFVSKSLSRMKEDEDQVKKESTIKWAAGTFYAAGVDTMASAISGCIIGLLANPEVIKKAQKELDAVLTWGELPTFEDQPNLPYITAICMEALRWRSIAPIAIPHLLHEDDIYKGYRIPKGSVVVANAWAMLHNEEIYPDPFKFNPDRFMKEGKINKEVKDPAHATWGFGRRVCPGRFLAFSSIWITIASILTAFDISKPVDESGKGCEPDEDDYISALVCVPKPFHCSMKPRSREHEQAIRATEDEEIFSEI
ncbi:hypothetical protein AMATHDRAFT_65777 [Amanita thiersii Skay4041]|uniref:Cytochrome P450 n=1 Tax=Amanita thiersii Skay4041 TaxID=703135 RepID=A0A2A9NE17_9AGAR|nr:hypothetical protein AMATHDRAFT_65777 [Amanita thiersii Skay4041]